MIMNENISLEHWVLQGRGNLESNMDGDRVMMNIQNGKYYNLGKSGGEIWDMAREPVSVAAIVNHFILAYGLEEQECQNQVIAFLEQLRVENLIQVGEE
ncbi:lasso peptide biosynthesis PqqD family chaperone [Paenibacillus sp. sgz302251]|uniref:lasso peptide biosynthesis PqqD family chaperone n=1 Tax=Paenibacillus sp. sgz302251 TaxID=3414493 RepID=UPI003C7BDBC5